MALVSVGTYIGIIGEVGLVMVVLQCRVGGGLPTGVLCSDTHAEYCGWVLMG